MTRATPSPRAGSDEFLKNINTARRTPGRETETVGVCHRSRWHTQSDPSVAPPSPSPVEFVPPYFAVRRTQSSAAPTSIQYTLPLSTAMSVADCPDVSATGVVLPGRRT